MKTFHIYQTMSFEYFVEAETESDAIRLIDENKVKSTDQTEIDLKVADVHNGIEWELEHTV